MTHVKMEVAWPDRQDQPLAGLSYSGRAGSPHHHNLPFILQDERNRRGGLLDHDGGGRQRCCGPIFLFQNPAALERRGNVFEGDGGAQQLVGAAA